MAQVGSIRGLSVRYNLSHARQKAMIGSSMQMYPVYDRLPIASALQQYIKKIRAASTQEEREAIVQKELAKIRGKYSSNKKCSGAHFSVAFMPYLRLQFSPGIGLASGGVRCLTGDQYGRICAAYDRKKYTWKLLYSHMMGYDVDFGHKQAADLIPSNNYDEKQVGYQALTILLNEVRLRN